MKILSIVSGIFMVAAGAWCFANPGAALGSLIFLIAVFMIASGLCSVGAFFRGRKAFGASGWLLADGILSSLLGASMLCDLAVSETVMMVFFGMWLLTTGMFRCMTAFALKKLGVVGWGWLVIAGILGAGVGFAAFASPLTAGFALMYVIGVLLILQGIGAMLNGYYVANIRDRF